jgi:hypothetical protein
VSDFFSIESAQATSELVGDGAVQDVIQVWVRSKPNGVLYPMRVPDPAFSVAIVSNMAVQSAQVVEQIRVTANVGDMSHVQDVTEAGDLLDRMTVYVMSSNGYLSRPVPFPLSNFVPPAPAVAFRDGGGTVVVGDAGGGDVGIYGATGADAGAAPAPAGTEPTGPDLLGGPTVDTTATAEPSGATAGPAPAYITPGPDPGPVVIGGGGGGGATGGGTVTAWLPPILVMQTTIARVAAQLDAIAGL